MQSATLTSKVCLEASNTGQFPKVTEGGKMTEICGKTARIGT